MNYDITKKTAPEMPQLGNGLDCIKLIASQVSPDMREAIIPMIFPALGAHVSGTEFMYPDLTWKELCGMLAHLVADSGMGKGQLTAVVEAIMRSFRKHDETELQKLVAWQKQVKSKGANKEKPVRPDVSFWFPPSDVTNPAFLQNAMALEASGGHTQYFNLTEIEMADRLCGGHKQVSQSIRNIYDRQRSGALRATAEGISGNPLLRANMTFSSTPFAARKFYKNDLYTGTFGRIPFSYKPRKERSGRIPRQGKYDAKVLAELDKYLLLLASCKGRFIVPQLNKLADKLAKEMAELADLTDDDNLWDASKRSIVNAWKCGCLLYILNGQQWTHSIGAMVEWLAYHDLWSKIQVFGDLLNIGDGNASDSNKKGPQNMLDNLPEDFNEAQLEALRMNMGKPKDAKNLLNVWKHRGFITYSPQTGLYSKTQEYLTGSPTKKGRKKTVESLPLSL